MGLVSARVGDDGAAELPEQLDAGIAAAIGAAFRERQITMAAVSGTYNLIHPNQAQRRAGLRGLRALAAEAGLGVILDIVPNHMGTGDENRWWADPEERKRVFDVDPETGFYRRFFDIDDLAAVQTSITGLIQGVDR